MRLLKKCLHGLRSFWHQRLMPPLVARVGMGLIRCLLWSCRIEVEGEEKLRNAVEAGPVMVLLWHSRLILVVTALERTGKAYKYAAVVSGSRDGMVLESIVNRYPNQAKVIKVKHTARHGAMKAMVQSLQSNEWVLLVTPDGPRGPKEVMKPGAPTAAASTGASVIPFSWRASKLWTLGTWDQMAIPRPFSKITLAFGDPKVLSEEACVSEAQEMLDAHHQNICGSTIS